MSATLWLGLVLQAASIAIMFVAFRRATFRRVGPYFVIAAFVFSGVTEIWQRVEGIPSRYRTFAGGTEWIDRWTVVAGAAMILYSVGYVLTARSRTTNTDPATAPDVDRITAVLNWRVLAVLCIPLLAVVGTSSLNYGTQQIGVSGATSSPTAGLSSQFLVIALSLATISFVATHPGRFMLPVLIQLGVSSLIGSRQDVLIAAATTLFGLAILGRAPKLKQVISALVVVAILAISINAARDRVGRDQFQAASLTGRVGLVLSGTLAVIERKPVTQVGQTQPEGERLDGNSFPAAILHAQSRGYRGVGLTTVGNDLRLAVPSFVNPNKLNSNIESRSEKAYLNDHYGIDVTSDFLPTQFGAMLGYFGPIVLLFLALLMGAAVGLAERLFRYRQSPSRFVLTLALFTCCVSYSNPMDVWPLEFRGALAVVIVVTVIDQFRQLVRKHRSRKLAPAVAQQAPVRTRTPYTDRHSAA